MSTYLGLPSKHNYITPGFLVCQGGGIIGVAVGQGPSRLISSTRLTGSITTVVSYDNVTLALAVSVGIGLLFGFLPERRAACLNPIEALRYE